MSKLAKFSSQLASFFEIGLNIYPKDPEAYRKNRHNPAIEFFPATDVSKNYERIRYLGHDLLIKAPFVKKFVSVLETMDRKAIEQIVRLTLSQTKLEMKLQPVMPLENIELTGESDSYWGEVVDGNFHSIDKRFDGAFTKIKNEFEFIARAMTAAAPQFSKDGSKIKVDDVYFFFNADGTGEAFNIFLSPTLIPAIKAEQEIEPNRLPMSHEDYERYFGYPSANKEKAACGITLGDDILAALDRINEHVRGMFGTDLPQKYKAIHDYLETKVNGILIPTIVTVRLECYSEFGGELTAEQLIEGATPNAVACSEIIDKEVTAIQEHLKTIPIPEGSGIHHYSVEVDSLGIYGRDEQNVVVQAMVDPHFMMENAIMSKLSDGLQRVLVSYIKTVKNDSFFSRLGEITPKEEAGEEAVVSDSEANVAETEDTVANS